MNIFVTSLCPKESAYCLPDKHIVKMPLETCQMLSIVASDKWGHGYGTLPKSDGTPYNTDKGGISQSSLHSMGRRNCTEFPMVN